VSFLTDDSVLCSESGYTFIDEWIVPRDKIIETSTPEQFEKYYRVADIKIIAFQTGGRKVFHDEICTSVNRTLGICP
jgi:hypothetical protein